MYKTASHNQELLGQMSVVLKLRNPVLESALKDFHQERIRIRE